MDMRGFSDSEKPAGIQSYFVLNMVEDLRLLVTGLGKKKFKEANFRRALSGPYTYQ